MFQTYLYVDDDNNYVGYISFSIASINKNKANNKIDIPTSINYEVSSLKITRLCIFDDYLKCGIGTNLITFCEILAISLQKIVGCRAMIVDSKIEAISFYEKLGFIQIEDQENDSEDTVFMVYDLIKPNELKHIIDYIVEFCEEHELKHLIPLLNH